MLVYQRVTVIAASCKSSLGNLRYDPEITQVCHSVASSTTIRLRLNTNVSICFPALKGSYLVVYPYQCLVYYIYIYIVYKNIIINIIYYIL